jgi:hypothetical protein
MKTIFDNRIFEALAMINECLCGKIEENGLPKLCFCGIIAGQAPYDATGVGDGCDDDDEDEGCGQAWVRLVTAYPSSAVGIADTNPGNCGKGVGFDVEIGILRCISIEDNGGAIEAEEMLSATSLQIADMLTMQQALMCCSVDSDNFVLGAYTPIGPEGMFVGGSWLASVLID